MYSVPNATLLNASFDPIGADCRRMSATAFSIAGTLANLEPGRYHNLREWFQRSIVGHGGGVHPRIPQAGAKGAQHSTPRLNPAAAHSRECAATVSGTHRNRNSHTTAKG